MWQMQILRMLQRVYPESSAISQKSQNLRKYVTKSNLADEYIITFPCRALSEVSHLIYGGGDTNWKKECWIKLDAECKYTKISKIWCSSV